MAPTRSSDSQLLKGVLSLILLRLLAREERYGYEIVSQLHDRGLTQINDGTVYSALNRLEREGHLDAWLRPSASGPARKYYRASASGQAELAELEASWHELVRIVATTVAPAQVPSTSSAPGAAS